MADQVVQRLAQDQSAAPAIENKTNTSDGADSALQRSTAPTISAPTPLLQRQAEVEPEQETEQEAEPEETLQRKPIFDSPGIGDEQVQRKCAACGVQEEGMVQRIEATAEKAPPEVQTKCAACEAEEGIQPKRMPAIQRSGDGSLQASDDFSGRLQASKGGGSPMSSDTRSSMEGAMGADFSGVRVHTGSEAANLSNDIGAQAFTHGSDVYFNDNKYDPGSSSGQHLLAHELTHTVQQGGVSVINTKIDQAAPQLQKKDLSATTAAALIDKHTSWGFLDEEALGKELADGMPKSESLTKSVFASLSDSDRDDIAFEIVKELSDRLSVIPGLLRIHFIEQMVYGTVTDEEEGYIKDLWFSFGESKRFELVKQHRALWKKSLWESDQLEETTLVIREAFKIDVRTLARSFLKQNKTELINEAQNFGIDVEGLSIPIEKRDGYLEAVQQIAPAVLKLQNMVEGLRDIKVGYNTRVSCDEMGACYDYEVPVRFNPDSKPQRPPTGNESPVWPSWENTMTQHTRLSSVISSYADLFPSVFMLIQQEQLEELTKAGNGTQALMVISQAMKEVLEKIKESDDMVLTRDIDYFDLMLLQERLFQGNAGEHFKPSYTWDEVYYQDIAKDVLRGHEARQFWADLGLSLLAAAAIIAAPFSGGASLLLLGFGAVIGVGQAAVSWEKYFDLATLGEAHVKEELALVLEGQISAQLVEAIILTVAAFLDVYGATKGVTTPTKLATRKATLEVMEKELKQEVAEQTHKKMLREASKETALVGGGTVASILGHEMSQEEEIPEFETTAEVKSLSLSDGAEESSSTPVSGMVIQLSPGGGGASGVGSAGAAGGISSLPIPTTGPEFEIYIERALLNGELGLPQMNYVVPGQYTGSGWGIDRIGIAVDEATGEIKLLHFEMKFVSAGKTYAPGLGKPKKGMQTGLSWTDNAVEKLLNSTRPEGRHVRQKLLEIMEEIHGRPYYINELSTFLKKNLVSAPVQIVVPDTANITRLLRQVKAMTSLGRNAKLLKVKL